MNATVVIVTVLGVVLGYWVVSLLFRKPPRDPPPPAADEPPQPPV